MPNAIRTREDVRYHSDGFGGGGRPAVNVKVYDAFDWREDLIRRVARDHGEPGDVEPFVTFIEEWREKVDGEQEWELFGLACSDAFDMLNADVTGENGWKPEGLFGQAVKLDVEGRSGGWIVVDGLPDVEEWDGVMLARWRSFVKLAGVYVEDVPYQMLSLLYLNDFERWSDPAKLATPTVGVCAECGGPGVKA